MAYFCVGFVPNTDFLQAECGDLLSKRGHIKVNEYLQVEGHPNIFAVGDVADVDEEKLAQALCCSLTTFSPALSLGHRLH